MRIFKTGLIFIALCSFPFVFLTGAEDLPQLPKFYLNGKPETPTVQDLSGILTRPLRLLVRRNNKKFQGELMQVYAMGVRDGDTLRVEMGAPPPGMRVTLYKIFREPAGARYMSMPLSVYHGEAPDAVHEEKVLPSREEYLIAVYEKTNSPHEKDVHVRYFQERVRKLMITSFKTNLMLSSLKFKMKDFADSGAAGFFEKNAQEMVDGLINPRRIFLIRLWKWRTEKSDAAAAQEAQSTSFLDVEKDRHG